MYVTGVFMERDMAKLQEASPDSVLIPTTSAWQQSHRVVLDLNT
jgi:hypothetical protein